MAARAYLIEVDGRRVAERGADTMLPPASLTKMMSGLLVIERRRPLDSPVRISAHAAAAPRSRLGLKRGEVWAVGQLLTAMLVVSSNDACRALAEWHSGSEAAFVGAMNRRARALGMRHTHFVNACGFDAAGHRSTADDLARLARAAMAEPEYALRAGRARAEIVRADGRRRLLVDNHNLLIGRAEGVIGVKTGFTLGAGKCLVALARRGEREVLLVMLHGRDRWWDAQRALDEAFALPAAPGHR